MTDERTLPQALQTFHRATSTLIDPHPNRPSIYAELREAIHGHRAGRSGQPAQSQPPLWIDGVDLATLIDNTVRQWHPTNPPGSSYPTVNRLRALADRPHRPQDVDLLQTRADELTGWVNRYNTLVNDKPLTLPNPCPRCDHKFTYRTVDGEQVRVPTLQITLQRCVCLHCHASWPPDKYEWLSRLLGYDPLPGVLDY